MDFGASLHCLVFVRKPILILLEGVIKGGSTTTSLINFMMRSIMEKRGVLKKQITRKFLSFGTNGTFVM
jgi:hypothetical protein